MFDAVTPLIGLPDHIKCGIENVCINEVRNESILKEDEKYCAFFVRLGDAEWQNRCLSDDV